MPVVVVVVSASLVSSAAVGGWYFRRALRIGDAPRTRRRSFDDPGVCGGDDVIVSASNDLTDGFAAVVSVLVSVVTDVDAPPSSPEALIGDAIGVLRLGDLVRRRLRDRCRVLPADVIAIAFLRSSEVVLTDGIDATSSSVKRLWTDMCANEYSIVTVAASYC